MIEAPPAAPARSIPRQRHRGLLLSERRLFLAALDVVAVAVAYVLAFNVRTAEVRHAGFYVPRTGTAIAAGMWLIAAQFMDAYNLRSAATVRGTLRAVGGTLGITAGGLLLIFFAVPFWLTRPTILLWMPIAAVLVTSSRLVYRNTLTSARLAQPIALVAGADVLEKLWPDVRAQANALYHVCHVIDPNKPGAAERLAQVCELGRVSEVIVGVRDDASRELFASLLRCYDSGLRVRSLADLYEELTGRLLLDQLGHSWLLSLPMRSETSRVYGFCKRAIDVATGLVACAVLAVVLPPLALLIKLDDGGPVFHRQTRVGKYGSTFELAKLRSMRVSPAADTHWTENGDARITRVGRFLRATHLDELPQAWSILRGDMSLIGPRPEQPQYVSKLEREIDFYRTRLTVRPGLTGWAQVNFGYGAGIDGARAKLSFDLYYIKRQSAALDLLIMARTAISVLSLGGR